MSTKPAVREVAGGSPGCQHIGDARDRFSFAEIKRKGPPRRALVGAIWEGLARTVVILRGSMRKTKAIRDLYNVLSIQCGLSATVR
jgi:hypothetical protein